MSTLAGIEKKLDVFFSRRGWKPSICLKCGYKFFTQVDSSNCGSYTCENVKFYLKPNQRDVFLPLNLIEDRIRKKFRKLGYLERDPVDVIHAYKGKRAVKKLETTLFTVSGIQLLDEIFLNENPYDMNVEFPLFVFQPSVRLKFIKNIGDVEGVSTSFVNISLIDIDANSRDFVFHLSNCMELLEELDLIRGMKFKIKKGYAKWGRRTAPGIFLKANYSGCEIGDLGYICDFPISGSYRTNLIDFGFGLERLSWVLNQAESYFDIIGPLFESALGNYLLMDLTRTLTLIIGSNVKPNSTIHGRKIKNMISLLGKKYLGYNLLPLVLYYYTFWKKFIPLSLKPSKISWIIEEEIEKTAIKLILDKLKIKKLPSASSLSFYDSVDKMIEKVGYKQLKAVIKGLYNER